MLDFSWLEGLASAELWSGIPVERPALLALLLAGLLIDGVFPDFDLLFRVIPHPVRIVGAATRLLDRRLNRERRGEGARLIRGLLVVMVLTALAAGAGWLVHLVALDFPYGWLIELAAIVVLLAQRSLFHHVRAVARGLELAGLRGGRAAVRHIVGRDPETLDEHGVARAAIESCAENFSDGVVAPAFWYILLGLPGLFAYKAVNTMDSMIGYRTARHGAFGFAAARLDDVVNYVPARLSGLLLALAAVFAATASPLGAFRVMRRDAAKHRSPNAGWPEGAMAGALGLALAGPRSYDGRRGDEPWIGDGRARATVTDIHRALYLYAVACLIHLGLIAVLTAGLGLI